MDFIERYGPWALVTGAAKGVGHAFTLELIERGLSVVMVDIDPAVHDVASDLGDDALALTADVAAPTWIEAVESVTSHLDVGLAVANAGAAYVGHYADMTASQRRRILDVNCSGTADLVSWALPRLIARDRGAIVAVSSGSALAGTAGVSFYSATKAFSVNLMEAVGWELKDTGVDSMAIVAPSMDTPAFWSEPVDKSRMPSPTVDPRVVVSNALDALGDGPSRWLADDGLAFAAEVPRADRVGMMGSITTGMYPTVFETP